MRRFLERFWGGSLTRMTGEMLTARALGDEELESLHHLLEKTLAERYTGCLLYTSHGGSVFEEKHLVIVQEYDPRHPEDDQIAQHTVACLLYTSRCV